MKRGKKLGILLLALVVLCGAAFAAKQLNRDAEDAEEDTPVTILSVDASQVTELSWTYTESLSFLRDGESWSYAGDDAFPVDESFLDAILTALGDLSATKTIEDVEDFDQYGLEEPTCTVTVEGDSQVTLAIGNESSGGDSLYVSIGDGNVYMVDVSLLDCFAYGLYDLVNTESIPDMSNVTGLTIDAETQYLELVHLENSGLAYSDSYTWFLKDGDGYTTLDTELTETLLSTFTDLSWSSCVDYNAQDLSAYGLDSPAATVSVAYTDEAAEEETFVLELGGYSDSSCYARIAGSGMVYLVDASVCDTALYTVSGELLPDDVLLMDWDGVTGVDVTLDGEAYSFLKRIDLTESGDTEDGESSENDETIWTVEGQEVDGASIWDALDALTSTGSGSGLSADRAEEISFIIHQDSDTYPDVELTFYQYDSASCLVGLNGETRLFVSRSDIVALAELVKETVLELES